MKKIALLGLLATTTAFADMATPKEQSSPIAADVKSQYAYLSLGLGPFPLPMPLFGVGGRFQNNHHGADISLQGISFGRNFTALRENVDYLYYFKPKPASQFYVGGGLSVTAVISKHGKWSASLSPQLLFGKQYTNTDGDVRFFQAQIDPVFLNLNKKHSWGTFPIVVISYGICF
jgi:hypothetical protein